ncbi:hypothetical protein ACSVJE_21170, partial [Pseudomonas aeruginosa]
MVRLENDIQPVERFINHTHIYDIFSGCNEDVEDEIFEQLAHMLSLSWRLILKEKFPDRDFSVLLSCSDQDYGPTITFFRNKNTLLNKGVDLNGTYLSAKRLIQKRKAAL